MYPSAFERTRSDELFDGGYRSGSLARYARAPPPPPPPRSSYSSSRSRGSGGYSSSSSSTYGGGRSSGGGGGGGGDSCRPACRQFSSSLVVHVHFDLRHSAGFIFSRRSKDLYGIVVNTASSGKRRRAAWQ